MKTLKTILVTAGGTAGHTLPALELSNELVKRNYKVIFITDTRMFAFVNKNNKYKDIKTLCFHGRGLYKKKYFKNIKSIILLILAILQSLRTIYFYKPLLAYGFGGGITIPPLWICNLFKIPIILHEGNMIVGKANKFLSTYAKVLTTSFPRMEGNIHKNVQKKCVGMPVRSSIEDIYKNKYIIKNNELIKILITGGSLGAEVMATKVAKALSCFPKDLLNKIFIIQQVRKENITYVKNLYDNASIQYKLESYIENFSECLNWCHLIICRSGAGTIAENLISGKPSIMIPLPTSSDNHQMKNALMIKDMGAGWIISDNELSDQKQLIIKLKHIIFNKPILYEAAKLAKKNAIMGSSVYLVDIGQKLIKGNN